MKTYKFIEVENEQILKMTDSQGKTWTIPQDPANSDYAEHLRYTEWVEAGNEPEDFWTQDEALLTEGEEE